MKIQIGSKISSPRVALSALSSLCVVTVAKLATAPSVHTPSAASSAPELSRARLLVRHAHAFALRSLLPRASRRLATSRARHGHQSPLHAEPSTELAPLSTNPQIRLISSPRSSRTRPSPPRLAGTPPQRHSTTAARRLPWSRRHRPPPRAPRTPTGPRRSPLAPPPLPRRQQSLPWPESPFPFHPSPVFATRDCRQQ